MLAQARIHLDSATFTRRSRADPMRPYPALAVLLLAIGCKPPDDAPADLDDLCAWLFTHVPDRRDDALEVGVANLAAWLEEHPDETREGYAVDNLDGEALSALDDRERPNEGLVGATVTTDSPHAPDELAFALVSADQTDVFPDSYDVFDRTFDGDPDCFVDGACERIELDNHAVASLALGIHVTTDSTGQFRWVQTDAGPALITRSWLHEPADVDVAWLQVDAQYNLTATLPRGDGAVRLQALWVEARLIGLDLPDATVLNSMIRTFQRNDETLYAWVSSQ